MSSRPGWVPPGLDQLQNRVPHLRDNLVAKVGIRAKREPISLASHRTPHVNNAGKSRPPKTTRSILTQRSIMRKRTT